MHKYCMNGGVTFKCVTFTLIIIMISKFLESGLVRCGLSTGHMVVDEIMPGYGRSTTDETTEELQNHNRTDHTEEKKEESWAAPLPKP